jgi:MFS transporter, MHS family, proline/betaine transporter
VLYQIICCAFTNWYLILFCRFDFSAFGSLIDIIAINFFPTSESHSYQLLQSLAFFGMAFVMRPLGGIMMGYIGDKVNRKRALEVSIFMMFIPSLMIGFLPTYAAIGYYSYFLLLILRLIQGLAAGGEMIGAFLYTLESCDGKNVGFWGGACKASGNFGTAFGVGLVTLLRSKLTREQMIKWGWRIPFIFSLVFGITGLITRMKLKDDHHDSLEYEDKSLIPKTIISQEQIDSPSRSCNSEIVPEIRPRRSPFREALHAYPREIFVILLAASFWACSFYTGFVWLVYFMQDPSLIGGSGVSMAWIISFFANVSLVFALPMGGSVGDFVGNSIGNSAVGCRYVMELACCLMFLLAIPAFLLIMTRLNGYVLCGQFLLVVPVSLYGANLPFFMMSMIDSKKLRYTAMGVGTYLTKMLSYLVYLLFSLISCLFELTGYNMSHAIFTSTTSLIQTSLVLANVFHSDELNHSAGDFTHSTMVIDDPRLRPAYYLMFISLLAWATLSWGVSHCAHMKSSSHKQTSYELVTKSVSV